MLCPKCGYYTDREDMVCPECGEILNTRNEAPAEGAESIRQGKRARQAIRDAAARQSLEARRRKRSGASHATVEMPAVKDDRMEEDASGYTVSESDAGYGEPEDGDVFERRRRSVYDEEEAREEKRKEYLKKRYLYATSQEEYDMYVAAWQALTGEVVE